MDFIQSILPAIQNFHVLGYWIAFLVAFAETVFIVGMFFPGSVILLFMGGVAASGYFDVIDLIWFALFGAILGDNINYYIGKKYGAKLFKNGFWFIKPEHFKKGEKFIVDHGRKSVFIARFFPTLKEITPLVAGTLNMKKVNFIFWNALGAIGWSLVWILPGYYFAQSFDVAKLWLDRAGFFIVMTSLFLLLLYWLKIILIRKGKEFFYFSYSVWCSIKKAVINNEQVVKLVNKHQKFFIFLNKRTKVNSLYGLPLTLVVLSLLYLLLMFGGIIEDIITSDIIVSADVRIANLLVIFRTHALTEFFTWVTLLGKSKVVLVFLIAVALVLWIRKKRDYIIPLFVSVIGAGGFAYIGKILLHRARPDVAMYIEDTFSFPSGHATIAVAFYGFLAYVLIRNIKNWKRKVNVFFAGLVLILFIGFSRLYLGVHYLSDIWGGYLVGAIWLIIAISISEYFRFNKRKVQDVKLSVKNSLVAISIIVLAILFYIIFAFNYRLPGVVELQKKDFIKTNNVLNIFNDNNLKFTETLIGDRQEPISFIIMAKSDDKVIEVFKQAGWSLSDEVNLYSIAKITKAAIFKESYKKAPMTPDFWNTKVHNFGFEKSTQADNVRTRHHARFWKTDYITKDGDFIYVGTASFDSSIKWGVTHKIDQDIDTEREYLFSDLQKTGSIISYKKQQFVKPKIGINFSGDQFFSDGKVYIITVK